MTQRQRVFLGFVATSTFVFTTFAVTAESDAQIFRFRSNRTSAWAVPQYQTSCQTPQYYSQVQPYIQTQTAFTVVPNQIQPYLVRPPVCQQNVAGLSYGMQPITETAGSEIGSIVVPQTIQPETIQLTGLEESAPTEDAATPTLLVEPAASTETSATLEPVPDSDSETLNTEVNNLDATPPTADPPVVEESETKIEEPKTEAPTPATEKSVLDKTD